MVRVAMKTDQLPDFIAVYLNREYRWYDKRFIPVATSDDQPPGVLSVPMRPTGQFTSREDGEVAEIYELVWPDK